MPDLPARNCHGGASLQRRQSLINVVGCMGAFSQIFPLNKMLGGSNKFLASPDAQAQSLGSKTRCPLVEKQSALRRERTQEAEISIDLRKMLDAKQEPFVLQDVIWEKRHPIRSKSSRELKFDMNETVPSSRKPRSSKRDKSRDSKRHEDVGGDGDVAAQSQRSGKGSYALVKGNHVPAESMVALPSNPASPQARKTRSSSSKMASTGKSPVKSPNKRALLMEAAAKILEGSNRRASLMASSSARSLLRELEGSKQAQDLLRSKKAPLGGDSINSQRTPLWKVPSLERKRPESKQHSYCNASFVNRSQLSSPKDSSEMSDEEVLMIMQSRLYPSDGMPAAIGGLSELAMAAETSDVPQLANHVQGLTSHYSSLEGMERKSRPVDEQTHQEVESIMVPATIGRNYMLSERDASVEKSEDLELPTYTASININLINESPMPEFVHSVEWNARLNHPQAEISRELHFSISGEMPVGDVDSGIDAARSGSCETRIEEIDAVYVYAFSELYADGPVKSYTITDDDKSCISVEARSEEVESAENDPTPVLLLCNYSWWTQEEMQAYSPTPIKNENLNDLAGYHSPIAATKGPSAIKVSEEWKEEENLEVDSSASPDHSYAEELQQFSPVSVLDAVYEDGGPVLSKPFDYFDEARQKLLESVRRYEMLAHMDLDMLIKINEESLCHEFEEESDASSFKESWGSDVTDTCATQRQVPLMGSPDYELSRNEGNFLYVEAEDLTYDSLYAAAEDDFYSRSNEDLYMQQLQVLANKDVMSTSELIMDARARYKAERESGLGKALLDCVSEPSDLHASHRNNSSRHFFEAVEKLMGSVVINAMLHMDLTSSSWGSFHEEVEVMEMELESSLLAALMQELLSDLIY